ncbi:MAG: hypothetical protein NC337_15630 [Roseburia sp.]|nr:hypothetical protein [Roseburia sp.]
MEYFELSRSEKVENPIELMALDAAAYSYAMTQKDFEALDRMKVAYFSGNEAEEICDLLVSPTFLVSDRLKRLLALYEKETEFKGIQLFPTAEDCRQYPMYWVPRFPEADCVHESSVWYDNGMLSSPVLDGGRIGRRNVFRLPGLREYKAVVSLPVAESILRRRLYGVELRRMEVV